MKYIEGIKALLEKKECIFWVASSEKWSTANSTVDSSPVIRIAEIYRDIGDVEVAISLVDVSPVTGEPLHYHASHVVGVVIEGEASFRYQKAGKEVRVKVVRGDVVLVPEGAYHVFECSLGQHMKYMALEFADKEIDYQQHRLF